MCLFTTYRKFYETRIIDIPTSPTANLHKTNSLTYTRISPTAEFTKLELLIYETVVCLTARQIRLVDNLTLYAFPISSDA